MATRKRIHRRLGWLLLFIIIAMVAVLFYPSMFHITQSKAHLKANQAVANYQAAINRCIHDHQGQLSPCHAGSNGIPAARNNWVRTVSSIHVYQGVIRALVRLDLGKKLFIYYIPRPVQRRWSSSTADPQQAIHWQRIDSKYCGLDEKIYSCEHFAKH